MVNWLMNFIQYYLVKAIMTFLLSLPLKLSLKTGGAIGKLYYLLDKRHRKRGCARRFRRRAAPVPGEEEVVLREPVRFHPVMNLFLILSIVSMLFLGAVLADALRIGSGKHLQPTSFTAKIGQTVLDFLGIEEVNLVAEKVSKEEEKEE